MSSIKGTTLILTGIIIGLSTFLLIGFNSSDKKQQVALIENIGESGIQKSNVLFQIF